jgi:hypothetical protein
MVLRAETRQRNSRDITSRSRRRSAQTGGGGPGDESTTVNTPLLALCCMHMSHTAEQHLNECMRVLRGDQVVV